MATLIVIVLVVVLVVVPLALYGASRLRARRPQSAEPSASSGGNRLIGTVFVVATAAFGVALPLIILTGNHSNASAKVGNVRLTPGEKSGRELFGAHCGVCHTLYAANAIGKVGPNLNLLKPPASLVLHTINNGCLPNASGATASEICLGQGVMPAQVVTGRDAQDVADFVAAATGSSGSASASSSASASATSSTTSAGPTTTAAGPTSTTASSSSSATSPPPAATGPTQVLALAANPSGGAQVRQVDVDREGGQGRDQVHRRLATGAQRHRADGHQRPNPRPPRRRSITPPRR